VRARSNCGACSLADGMARMFEDFGIDRPFGGPFARDDRLAEVTLKAASGTTGAAGAETKL
jgi:hypothetical protein